MNILFATDGSGPARAGEDTIAALFDGAASRVTVMTVAPTAPYEMVVPDVEYGYTRLDLPPFDPERIAKEAADRLGERGFSVASSFTRGDPSREILHQLDEGDFGHRSRSPRRGVPRPRSRPPDVHRLGR